MDTVVLPDALVNDSQTHLWMKTDDQLGKRSWRKASISKRIWQNGVCIGFSSFIIFSWLVHREVELHAMRMGPGKHLQGRKLMGGMVKPEEFDYFHEVGFRSLYIYLVLFNAYTFLKLIITQEISRAVLRGYGDGMVIYYAHTMTRPHHSNRSPWWQSHRPSSRAQFWQWRTQGTNRAWHTRWKEVYLSGHLWGIRW